MQNQKRKNKSVSDNKKPRTFRSGLFLGIAAKRASVMRVMPVLVTGIALAGLEARVGFANDIDALTATHDLTIVAAG